MAAAAPATAHAEPKSMSTDQQGLEKAAAKTPAIITTPDEYRSALLRWQEQKFHILTPFANISGLAPSHGLISTSVRISVDKNDQEVYDGLPFLKNGEVALAKRGLRKIAEGLGISTRLEYISVGTIRDYWHVKAIASYRGVDGATIEREASAEWDMRDASVRKNQSVGGQVNENKKNGLRHCEARAINAAIRECGCGIKQAYSRDELARPFLAIRVMFTPDMTNPEERRVVLERALGSTNALYPQRGLPAPSTDAFEDDQQPRHVGRGTTQPAVGTPPVEKKPEADLPPVEGAVKIAKVETKSGETKGRKWTKYTIVDSNGVAFSTFDKQHCDDADRFKAENAWVEIVTERDGDFVNVVEIIKAGSEPQLPGLDAV